MVNDRHHAKQPDFISKVIIFWVVELTSQQNLVKSTICRAKLKNRKPPDNFRAECGVRSERKLLSPPSPF